MRAAIIDYGSGNLRSAAKAIERAARELGGGEVVVTADANELARATHVVLPGVGAFRDCRDGLTAIPGMAEALARTVTQEKKPFLGICVGMQLMADVGREHGDTPGFGWIQGEVARIAPKPEGRFKIPHMGWNALQIDPSAHPVLKGLQNGGFAYFVHSYAFCAKRPDEVLARVDYGGPVTAIVGRDNLIGTQFHPEKSQAVGLAFLAAFLRWRP
jgi:glutamine amidotransferase